MMGGFRVQGSGFGEEGRSGRWAPVVVALVALVAMGRLCAMDFTWWDDPQTLHHNPRLNPATWESVGYYWTHEHMGLYVPVTYTIWAGLAAVSRVGTADDRGVALNPWVFHGANVIVHAINAVLVYLILKRAVKREWAAAAGAMVFAVHPVQVETVGWVSGMKDLLCGSFVLGAVWNYLAYCGFRIADCGLQRQRLHYWSGLLLMVLGMLSKPTAVVTPVIAGALGVFVVGRNWRQVLGDLWPWAAAVVPCVVWAKMVQSVPANGPLWSRPLVALDAVAFYMGKVVWPGRMAVDYGRNPAYVIETGAIWWTWVVPVVVAGVLWWKRREWGVLAGAGVVFVAGMAPVSGVTPFMFQGFSTVADHYIYLPMLGVGLAVAWVASRWPTRWMAGAVAGVVCVLAGWSMVQAGVWEDDLSLTRHAIEVNPRSHAMRSNLASALAFRARQQGSAELHEQAIRLSREALALKPDSAIIMENLAEMLIEKGEVDEAIELLRGVVEHSDRTVEGKRDQIAASYRMLGAVLASRGRHQEAAEEYRKALRIEPENQAAQRELAAVEGPLRERTTKPATRSTTRSPEIR